MKTFLCALFLFLSCPAFSQTFSYSAKDTLICTDGTKYVGTMIKTTVNEDNQSGEVQFMTTDGQMHTVPTSNIAKLKRAPQVQDNKLPPAGSNTTTTPAHPVSEDETSTNWSDPGIPHNIVVKHNTGIGLAVTGSVFIVAGIGLIAAGAAANGQRTTYTNGYSTQTNVNIGATGGIGLLFTIAGLPMMIVGAVKTAKASKMARARRTLLH